MTPRGDIGVELVYAEPQRAVVGVFRLGTPATIADVLRLAAADAQFAGIDMTHATVGVFGKPAPLQHLLADGDRVEIYRPLAADPKLARRARVSEARKKIASGR